MQTETCKNCINYIYTISICVCKMDKILDRDSECKFKPSKFVKR
jgi:hypothetical protein